MQNVTRPATSARETIPAESPGRVTESEGEALDSLAQAYGIEPEFIDAHGERRETAAATKRALLRSMGIAAETPAEVAAARASIVDRSWSRALAPVLVCNQGSFDLAIVGPLPGVEFTLRIALEDGGERLLRASFAALPLEAAIDAGGRRLERRRLKVSEDLPSGYHRLSIDAVDESMSLIVTPGACWLPPAVSAGERLSGLAIQLYLLRSARDWGIGDFSDLRTFVELAARRGADVVGLNPLHQMFSDDPEHASPYSPASRLLLNELNIDVTALPEYGSAEIQSRVAEPDFAALLQACRGAALVDYAGVAKLKFELLQSLFAAFERGASHERRAAFEQFRATRTPAIERTYVFTALREMFAAGAERRAAWQEWPPEYRDPSSPAVATFARERAREVTFVAWRQWIADSQLADCARAAAPMRVGLYRDLAVGADPAGAETWGDARAVVDSARVGAPPDIYNPPGQNWDLPPFDPAALRAQGYASFIELVRANMRHAGGLRIDHVMALEHLYWIPCGAEPRDGAYVRYPLEDLVGIIALESHRACCLVVGEDLGTVPAGFRERMARANILSYRVLFFERTEDGVFEPPAVYPRSALAVLGSHDLPTLGAWASGADIVLREQLGIVADPAVSDAARRQRSIDRAALAKALERAGVLTAGEPIDGDSLFAAAHAFLARSASALAVAQIDDVTAEIEPVNVPTTSDERPNWRRRLSLTLEELAREPRLDALFTIFAAAGRLRT